MEVSTHISQITSSVFNNDVACFALDRAALSSTVISPLSGEVVSPSHHHKNSSSISNVPLLWCCFMREQGEWGRNVQRNSKHKSNKTPKTKTQLYFTSESCFFVWNSGRIMPEQGLTPGASWVFVPVHVGITQRRTQSAPVMMTDFYSVWVTGCVWPLQALGEVWGKSRC